MSKVWLANLHLVCGGTGQLLLHVIFQAVSLKEPGVDVTWRAFATLLHHQLWIHELRASQCLCAQNLLQIMAVKVWALVHNHVIAENMQTTVLSMLATGI